MEQRSELGFTNHAVRFPSLEKAPGIMPWSPNQLDIWAAEFGRDWQAIHAARFILERWNSGFAWECGKFDPKPALECWDSVHRRAFLELVTSQLAYSA
jgi:hypothetical protein